MIERKKEISESKDTQLENYLADKPISDEKLDAFQRYGFSKRIAKTIIDSKNQDSLIFGILGVWGEGKSSVLNFINQELSSNDNILTLTFNPWRYGDEDSLIKNFLKKISELLGKELYSKKEKYVNFINKYIGKYRVTFNFNFPLSIIGVDLSKIGKNIADIDLEVLKNRVDEFIAEGDKKLVIFIDDIDRLDKQEIYSLFRLVKLTADFKKTVYILSFDQNMVASSIGEFFGSGDKKAGENFLEKIIQIPLTIPKAQPDALNNFCFRFVENTLSNSNLELSEVERDRFLSQFITNVSSRLSTPRLALRYGNILSFLIPLLKGEVNVVDLMLIEALKIFYPKYYDFVRLNPEYFIGSYNSTNNNSGSSNKVKSIKKYFETFGSNLSEKEKQKVKDLLFALFPNLSEAFKNDNPEAVFFTEPYEKLLSEKRIASKEYFERYFSYAVIDGEISDVEFISLLEFIEKTNNIDCITKRILQLLEKTTAENFLYKLINFEKDYSWEFAKKISKSLCDISNKLFEKDDMIITIFGGPFKLIIVFIFQLLKNHKKNHKNEPELFKFTLELMTYPKQLLLACQLNKRFYLDSREEGKFFLEEEKNQELAKILTERALKEAKDKGKFIFEVFPECSEYLGYIWAKRDKEGFDKYVESFLNVNSKNVIVFLKSCLPIVYSLAKPKPVKGDLSKENYERLISSYDKDKLFKKITTVYSLEEIQSEDPYWNNDSINEFSDLNMLRQFTKWYFDEKEKNKG